MTPRPAARYSVRFEIPAGTRRVVHTSLPARALALLDRLEATVWDNDFDEPASREDLERATDLETADGP